MFTIHQRLPPFDDIQSQVTALLESSFGASLSPLFWQRNHTEIFVDDHFKLCAIFEGDYLTKFAIAPDLRGQGLAVKLWSAISQKKFLWRCKQGNPIRPFYDKRATNSVLLEHWIIYANNAKLSQVLAEEIAAKEPDFVH